MPSCAVHLFFFFCLLPSSLPSPPPFLKMLGRDVEVKDLESLRAEGLHPARPNILGGKLNRKTLPLRWQRRTIQLRSVSAQSLEYQLPGRTCDQTSRFRNPVSPQTLETQIGPARGWGADRSALTGARLSCLAIRCPSWKRQEISLGAIS